MITKKLITITNTQTSTVAFSHKLLFFFFFFFFFLTGKKCLVQYFLVLCQFDAPISDLVEPGASALHCSTLDLCHCKIMVV